MLVCTVNTDCGEYWWCSVVCDVGVRSSNLSASKVGLLFGGGLGRDKEEGGTGWRDADGPWKSGPERGSCCQLFPQLFVLAHQSCVSLLKSL